MKDYILYIEILLKNKKIKYIKEYRFCEIRKWRSDFYLPEYKTLIEFEGGIWKYGRHNRAITFIKDCKKYNVASLLGFKVLRYTSNNLQDLEKDLDFLIKSPNLFFLLYTIL